MQIATENYFKLRCKKRSRFLEKKFNEADTSKLKFAAIETLLGSEKKQTQPSVVFPRVKLANKFNDFFLSKTQNILRNIPPVLVDFKLQTSGELLETFEDVDDFYVVLVSNQVSTKSQPSQKVPSRILKKLSVFYNQMSEIINESFLNAVISLLSNMGYLFQFLKAVTSEKFQTTDQSQLCISLPKLLKRSFLCNSSAFWINMQFLTSINLRIENIIQERQRY